MVPLWLRVRQVGVLLLVPSVLLYLTVKVDRYPKIHTLRDVRDNAHVGNGSELEGFIHSRLLHQAVWRQGTPTTNISVQMPLGSDWIFLLETVFFDASPRPIQISKSTVEAALCNHKAYANFHKYGHISLLASPHATKASQWAISDKIYDMLGARAFVLSAALDFLSLHAPKRKAYILVIETDTIFLNFSRGLSDFIEAAPPQASIICSDNRYLMYHRLVMDSACMFSNTKFARDVVHDWVRIGESLASMGFPAPGMGPFNVAILHRLGLAVNMTYDSYCEDASFGGRANPWDVNAWFGCVQTEYNLRLGDAELHTQLPDVYLQPTLNFEEETPLLSYNGQWPFSFSRDYWSMVSWGPHQTWNCLRDTWRPWLACLEQAAGDRYASLLDVSIDVATKCSPSPECAGYPALIHEIYSRGILFSLHTSGDRYIIGTLLHLPSAHKQVCASSIDLLLSSDEPYL